MPRTFSSRVHVYANVIIPVILVGMALGALWLAGEIPQFEFSEATLHLVAIATLFSLLRLTTAYFAALAVAIPLALLASRGRLAEKIFIPIYDIVQSIPVLAFFPLIVLVFIKTGFVEGAALAIIFFNMLWHLVFTLIAGLRIIPREIKDVGRVFKAPPFAYLSSVLMPAVVPSLVTGSLLAWAAGWNTIVVAEVLHTYIQGGTAAQDLLGVGGLIVRSSAQGNTMLFVYSLVSIIINVTILNFFVWQRLLTYAENFRFDA